MDTLFGIGRKKRRVAISTSKDVIRIELIMVNYNCVIDTIESLDSEFCIKNNSYNDMTVDNNSSDDSVDRVINWVKERG